MKLLQSNQASGTTYMLWCVNTPPAYSGLSAQVHSEQTNGSSTLRRAQLVPYTLAHHTASVCPEALGTSLLLLPMVAPRQIRLGVPTLHWGNLRPSFVTSTVPWAKRRPWPPAQKGPGPGQGRAAGRRLFFHAHAHGDLVLGIRWPGPPQGLSFFHDKAGHKLKLT